MKLNACYIVSLLLCPLLSLWAQRAPAQPQGTLMEQLEASIRSGEKRSLRDLGSLLDKPELKEKAQAILQNYTMFTKEEIDLSKGLNKARFFEFYYEHEKAIQFSELTGNYYLSSLSERKVNAQIELIIPNEEVNALSLLHATEEAIQTAINKKSETTLINQINWLRQSDLPEAQEYLLKLSEQLLSPNGPSWTSTLYQSLNQALAFVSDLRGMHAILLLLSENRIPEKEAIQSLAMISNIAITNYSGKDQIIQKYTHYMDSLETLENMRMFGYESVFQFQPSFFENMADYFGRVLCFANDREWLVYNAINDLIKTTHPRALFYLAAVGFKNEYHYPSVSFDFLKATTVIQGLTQIKIGVEDEKGNLQYADLPETSRSAQLNYLSYWAAKYQDYEWDASRDIFVNKNQALEKTQHYERLFRRLNSRNDSVALISFVQLTEGDPEDIMVLANKYRQMFRTYNPTLPPFKYKYLEQLAELTQFCRRYNISYKVNNTLQSQLQQLSETTEQGARYHLENVIIEKLKLEDITALEYWACLNQEHSENNFSVGRILDIFYSKHWPEILRDELQLRLYLKKADLYKNIGVTGLCNSYLNKFDISESQIKARLQDILKEETDEQIIAQIEQLAAFSSAVGIVAFSDFIENPMLFDKRDINVLPTPSLDDLKQIIQLIGTEEDNAIIGKYFFYLRLHPVIESVPYLMELASNDKILVEKRGKIVTIGDQVAPILEGIFNYSYPLTSEDKLFDITPWKEKWKKDKANYLNWVSLFFEEKIKFLNEQKTLSIADINQITESPNYKSAYKDFCMRAIKKVAPVSDIHLLNIEPKLSAATDLHYFDDITFTYKELDDIPKLFNVDNPDIMVKFLIKRAEEFELADKGSFYNNMFRHQWFYTYINSGEADLIAVAYIQQVLENYLKEGEYISEYEEQTTSLHIAQLQSIGKPLEERLLAPFDLNADIVTKAKIQENIISSISYKEIGTVAKYFTELTATLGPEPWAFLARDFGIPVFDLNDSEAYVEFRRCLNNMSEFDLYAHYLQKFGVDFLDKKKKLDFEKIATILRFDSVTPFVSTGGGKRDYHTYGVIKLLELHFGTRLGFHEKLNENQSFYTFSTAKRSNAWIEYLLEKNLIAPSKNQAPSFNKLVE
jgi:hypothetical protein